MESSQIDADLALLCALGPVARMLPPSAPRPGRHLFDELKAWPTRDGALAIRFIAWKPIPAVVDVGAAIRGQLELRGADPAALAVYNWRWPLVRNRLRADGRTGYRCTVKLRTAVAS